MKTKKSNIRLRELFRQKLEFAEVTPDPALRSKIMQQVGRQEFLRFNPGNFNIFYLGTIILALMAGGLMLYSQLNNDNSQAGQIATVKSDQVDFINIPVEKPIPGKELKNIHPLAAKENYSRSADNIVISNQVDSQIPEHNIKVPASLKSRQSGKSIFPTDTSENNIIQRSNTSEVFVIDPASSSGCAPLKVRFHSIVSSFDSCRWTFGDGGFSNKKDPEWIFDVEGEYKISLEIFNHGGKRQSSVATVIVHPRPVAHFEITPEKPIIPNDEVRFINYSTNAVRFKWDFGDGVLSDFFEPNHNYDKPGNYNIQLISFSEWGCSDSVTVFNAFSASEYFIDFPNAFIPNQQGPSGGYYSSKSDEVAQVFHPSYSGVTEYQLKIFSKLGIPIFESNEISLGWDGYNKGQLCESGVYIWKVRGKFRNGEPFIKMGDITLIKNQ